MMASKKPTITRVRIAREELEKMSKEDLHKCWNLQDQYVDLLENKLHSNSEHTELLSLRESEEKLKQQQLETSRRENILVMRLTTKEHEMQEFAGQIQEMKQAQVPTIAQLRTALLDPAVNLLFDRMRKEMDALKARLEETQNELSAWKFTPDSNTGKRLMAKCRLLYQENEELGKIISSGRMAKLEGDLALQKSFSEEMKKSQSELDEFLLELDEDVEGMQSTIYYLQTQLRESKDQIQQLQKEKRDLPSISNGSQPSPRPPENATTEIICKPSPQVPETIIQISPVLNSVPSDLNGLTVKLEPSSEKEAKVQESPPQKNNSPNEERKTVVTEIPQPVPEISQTECIAQSVIVVNKALVNHDKPVPSVERTKLVLDTSERTNDHIPNSETEEQLQIQNNADVAKATKRTPERGCRKRTRPRTPVEPENINEDNLPVRKRTRRREAEARLEMAEQEKRTPADKTETEFNVAETLITWPSTEQERTEVKIKVESSLGNGELSEKNCGKSYDS